MNLSRPLYHRGNKRGKSIYLAGPMSGIPEFNFPAFFEAQRIFEDHGWDVFNPAQKDIEAHGDAIKNASGSQEQAVAETGFDLRKALAWDTARICEADAIFMLRGWENSPGATAEHRLASAIAKGLPGAMEIIYQND